MPVWIRVGQEPTALADGAGGAVLDIFFSRLSLLLFFSLALWKTADIDWNTVLKGR